MDPFDRMLQKIAVRQVSTPPTTNGTGTENKREAAPACPICYDLGYITYDVPVGDPNFGKAFPCACQQEKRRLFHEQKIRSMSALGAFPEKTFDTFQTARAGLTPEQTGTLRRAAEMARQYATSPDGWLLLTGTYGSGKTHLAAAIANYRVSNYGETVMLVTAPDLLDHLRAAFGPASDQTLDDLFDQVRNTPLLILDDLGTESATPWAREKLYQLFNYRHSRRLPTVITTNVELELMDERVRSRLLDQDLTRSVPMDVPDHRSPASGAEFNLNDMARYQGMTFETFDDRHTESLSEPEQRQLETVYRFAEEYAQRPAGWLVLIGKPGTGKTHLAAAIAQRRMQQGLPVAFVACTDLLDYLRSSFTPTSNIKFDKRMYEIKTVPFLVLDNLVIDAHTSGWARERLHDILLYRFDLNLPTVITMYLGAKIIDERIGSRLENKARCTVPPMDFPPYRGGSPRRAARPRKPLP